MAILKILTSILFCFTFTSARQAARSSVAVQSVSSAIPQPSTSVIVNNGTAGNGTQKADRTCNVVPRLPIDNEFEIIRGVKIDLPEEDMCGGIKLMVRSDGLYRLWGDVSTHSGEKKGFAIAWAFSDAQNRTYTFERACEIGPSEGCVLDPEGIATFNENIGENWADIANQPLFNNKEDVVGGEITVELRKVLLQDAMFLLGHGLNDGDTVYTILRDPWYE